MGADLAEVRLGGDMSSYEVLVVNIMKGDDASSGPWDVMYDYAAMEMENIYQNSSLDGYVVRKYDTTYSPPCAPQDEIDELIAPQTHDWMQDHGLDAPGSYVWLMGWCGFAPLVSEGRGAWDEPSVAFVAENGRQNSHQLGVQGIHEALHNYIYDQCDIIQNDILDGDTGCSSVDDHNLGKVYTGWPVDEASPMLGWYGDCEATAGTCSDSAGVVEQRTTNPTSCTIDALEASADHARGWH